MESVAYFLNNSQICKEQYSRTLGTTTTVTIDNGTQVWRLIGEDEKGLPTNIGFGSLTQQLSFDLAGRVTGRKVRYGNEPYIQNAAYEYEVATGNMMMRTDSIYGHEEAFAYDYLNRLTDNGTGGYSVPVALVRDYGSDRWLIRHILRDNQGSIVAIADTAGNVIERNDYDPWGVLRQPQTQTPYSSGEVPELLLGRGYCGHEHLAEFGLINMNARLFAPALCRFLSPDPIVQAPDNSQSFNRYSYCLNNPMKYIDPSGLMVYYYDNKGHLLFTEDTGNCAMEKVFCGEGAVVFGKKRDAFGVNNYVPQNTNI